MGRVKNWFWASTVITALCWQYFLPQSIIYFKKCGVLGVGFIISVFYLLSLLSLIFIVTGKWWNYKVTRRYLIQQKVLWKSWESSSNSTLLLRKRLLSLFFGLKDLVWRWLDLHKTSELTFHYCEALAFFGYLCAFKLH